MRKIEKKEKIKIIIFITIIGIAAGQFGFIFSVRTKEIWRFDGLLSGSSPWGGELSFNVPPNPLASNKYVIEVSEYFSTSFIFEIGNITFLHLASNQSFFLEYFLGLGSFVGTEYASEIWILPPGMYNITWNNDDMRPTYKLFTASFFHPADQMVIMISGVIALFCAIVVIRGFIVIIKENQYKIKTPL